MTDPERMSAEDDILDRELSRGGSGHLPDDGFTDAVMRRLPPPRRGSARVPILVGSVAIGSLLALASPAVDHIARLALALGSVDGRLPAAVVLASVFAVLVGAGAQAAWSE